MADLTSHSVASTYKQILQINSGNNGLTGSIQYIQDGDGTSSVLGLSTAGVQINAANITINGFTLGVASNSTISGAFSGTVTTAAAVTFSGAFAFTGTVTGITTVTFPVTGTLSTLAGSEAFTNKTYNGLTITSTTGTLTIASGKTVQVDNTMRLAGSDATTITFQGTDTYVGKATTDVLTNKSINLTNNTLTTTSLQLKTACTDETGSGALVFADTPTLVTPVLGTPGSGTLTNCTGLPISTGVSGLGSNVATFLATPSSANLASALTDELGSDKVAFATAWASYTPTVSSSVGGDTIPVYTTNSGRWCRIGKVVFVSIILSGDGGAEGAGTGNLQIALPVACGASVSLDSRAVVGFFVNSTLTRMLGTSISAGASILTMFTWTAIDTIAAITPAFQNNTTRSIKLEFQYEID